MRVTPVLKRFDLHSTMYLLKQSYAIGSAASMIRFTFHYVSIKTMPSDRKGIEHPLFTFHYVSIKTTAFLICMDILLIFTFHYVSIKTNN